MTSVLGTPTRRQPTASPRCHAATPGSLGRCRSSDLLCRAISGWPPLVSIPDAVNEPIIYIYLSKLTSLFRSPTLSTNSFEAEAFRYRFSNGRYTETDIVLEMKGAM